MRKTWAVVVAVILLLVLALTLTSCAADPPRIALDDVVDFWVAPAKASEPDAPLYHPPQSLQTVVSVYNQASGHHFNHDTTPTLLVSFVLKDGTTISLSFSPLFPEYCALVNVVSPEESEGTTSGPPEAMNYEVKAPALAVVIWNLAGQHLDPSILEPDPTWVYPKS